MIPIDFIHIPKNCGTSVARLIHNGTLENVVKRDHHVDPMGFNPDNSMYILRDPIDRFVSAFYYSRFYPKCNLMVAGVETPSDLVRLLMEDPKNSVLINTTNHNIGKLKLTYSWVWTPQHFWDNNAKYVLYHDNIESDFRDFLEVTNRPYVELPKLNKSDRVVHEFTNDHVSFLKEMYKGDYNLIERRKEQTWKLSPCL